MRRLLLLFLGAVLQAQHSVENEKNPMAGNAAAVAAGKRLYSQACVSCHGAEARGDRAPALATGNFTHGAADGELFLNIRNGIKGTQMPAFSSFTSDQTWQLVTYLRSLAGTVKAKVDGDAVAGKTTYELECVSCHQVKGLGPDLSRITNLEFALAKRQKGNTIVATTADGHEYRGVRRSEDVFSLAMVDTDGQLHLFDKTKLKALRAEEKSLMPEFPAASIRNVAAYLTTVKATTVRDVPAGGLSFDRIRNSEAEPQNWLTYWGDLKGQHFSTLKQIDTGNVGQLQARWAAQLPGDGIVEAVPVVVDGVMYTAGPPGEVMALDARTGRPIWRYQRKQKVTNPYTSNRVNRGVAVLGNRVFFGTLDAALIALDARTGALLWESQVGDTMQGYTITSAPLAVKNMVITGVAGGEFGIRGFLDAYDAATGKRLWRFYTIPGPGEFGNDTWLGDSWKRGSGGTWLTGSYDAELNTLYWTVGNPGPDINGDVRKGDNLFTCSVVALDPDTGKRKWHYQFTPNDTHDWDSTEDVILVDRDSRKLLLHADRNGVFYTIDRTNGKLIAATPYVKTTWVDRWDENGRPVVKAGSGATTAGVTVYPSLGGGTNFQAPSYDARNGLMYFAFHDSSSVYTSGPAAYESGKEYWGWGKNLFEIPQTGEETQGIAALDSMTGKIQWRFPLTYASLASGVLGTSGGLVFAASSEGLFIALEAKSGKPLWKFNAGAPILSSPMSYAVDGKQFVAVSSAGVLYSFTLPE